MRCILNRQDRAEHSHNVIRIQKTHPAHYGWENVREMESLHPRTYVKWKVSRRLGDLGDSGIAGDRRIQIRQGRALINTCACLSLHEHRLE